jgi:hypothetical protein
VHLGSALNRFVRNERFDNWLLTKQMLRLLGSRPGPLLLALDWTAWQDRFTVFARARDG